MQPGVEPGDVILVLQQKDHELFTRQGDDLFMTKKIHLAEALCGFHMVIKHLDKRDLVVKYPAGQVIEPGECGKSSVRPFVSQAIHPYLSVCLSDHPSIHQSVCQF